MFAAIFIPNFSLQAVLRHEPDLRGRMVALVDPALPKPVIVQLTSAARSYGVREGLTPSQAMARCAELIIKARSLTEEESATEVLLQTAYAFSPNIESTAPGVCTLELKGLPFQSNRDAAGQWAEKIVEVLAQFYIEAKIGFAATPELALLAARAANPILVLQCENPEADSHAACVESFPISSLEPTPEILEVLRRWGIRTVGELLALGKDATAERLGPAVVELFNRISPDSSRPLKLVAPPDEFAEQIDFEHEIETAEPLLFVLRRFVEQLSRRLELIYLVVAEFHLRLGLASGAKHERPFKIPSPTGNIDILFRMLQTHLETVRTDSPITSLRLAAKPAKPEAQQFGLFESTLRDPNQFAETLARLTALVGSENMGTAEPVASHKPDSFRMAVPEFDSQTERGIYAALTRAVQRDRKSSETSPTRTPKRPEGRAPKNSRTESLNRSTNIPVRSNVNSQADISSSNAGAASPSPIGWERAGVRADGNSTGLQLRRFRPPLPSHIELREGTPSLLRSPIFIGPIVETRGPFFSSGNWWDAGRWAREEWDVETSDGSLIRIFRSGDGCFVEGVYD
jgi:protein ImuB